MARLTSAEGAVAVSFNFDLRSTKPNFARDQFETFAEMSEYTVCSPGKVSYCKETDKHYKFVVGTDGIHGGWIETNIGEAGSEAATAADVAELEERITNLESSYSNFTAKEVKVVDELPDASEETMNILYMVPNAGGTALENYVTTKSFDSDTYTNALITTLMGDTAWTYSNIYPIRIDDSDSSSPDDAQSLETQLTEIFESDSSKCIFLVTYGEGVDEETAKVVDLVHVYLNDSNAVVFEYYTQLTGNDIGVGSTVVVKNSEGTYIAMTVSNVETSGVVNKDWLSNSSLSLYTYDWYQAGTTDYDDSDKQDALVVSGGYVTGTIGDETYLFPCAVKAPTAADINTPIITGGNGCDITVTKLIGSSYSVNISNNQTNGVTYYNVSSSDTPSVDDGATYSTTGTATYNITANKNYASRTIYLAAATYLYGVAGNTVTGTYTVNAKLQQPTVSSVSGTDFESSRTITITNPSANPSVVLNYTLQYSNDGSAGETQTVSLSSGTSTTITVSQDGATNCILVAYFTSTGFISSNSTTKTVLINALPIYYGMTTTAPFADGDTDFITAVQEMIEYLETYSDQGATMYNSDYAVKESQYVTSSGLTLTLRAVRTTTWDPETQTSTENSSEYKFICVPSSTPLVSLVENNFMDLINTWSSMSVADGTYICYYPSSALYDEESMDYTIKA